MAAFAPSERGSLRYARTYSACIAGSESNVAAGAAKLGVAAGWIGRVGADEFGQLILQRLRADGVDCSQVKKTPQRSTGVMFKQRTSDETCVFYYRKNSAACALGPDDLAEPYFSDVRIFHFSGITPMLSDSCRKAVDRGIALTRRSGGLVSFDPNIRRKLWNTPEYDALLRCYMFKADIVEMGMDEALALTGESEPPKIAQQLFEQNTSAVLALKQGARGAWVADVHANFAIEPYACSCIEPIGAGDAFNAGFLAGIIAGSPLRECGRMGAIAGALATESLSDTDGQPDSEKMRQALSGTATVFR